jgi:hypothetical protein
MQFKKQEFALKNEKFSLQIPIPPPIVPTIYLVFYGHSYDALQFERTLVCSWNPAGDWRN